MLWYKSTCWLWESLSVSRSATPNDNKPFAQKLNTKIQTNQPRVHSPTTFCLDFHISSRTTNYLFWTRFQNPRVQFYVPELQESFKPQSFACPLCPNCFFLWKPQEWLFLLFSQLACLVLPFVVLNGTCPSSWNWVTRCPVVVIQFAALLCLGFSINTMCFKTKLTSESLTILVRFLLL